MANKPKNQAASQKKPTQEVATRKSTAVSTSSQLQQSLKSRIKKDAGKGLSTNMADNIVPLVYVLQAQSPQALKRNPKYIEGAEAGMLWLRNNADPLVDGEEGFLFQPCYFWSGFIEWQPNRGGFVARHDTKPSGVVMKEVKGDDGKTSKKMVTPAGNILVESKEYAGLILGRGAPMGYVLPMSGSNLSVAKEIMTRLNAKLDDDGDKLPLWWTVLRIKSKFRQKDENSWFSFDFEEAREIQSEEEYAQGQRLHDAFYSGAKRAEDADDGASSTVQDADADI